MRTVRLDLEYDGTRYAGWQRQKNPVTVQQTVEDALGKIANERVVLYTASRTDAGVHARHQVASFSLHASRTPASAFLLGAPSVLPPDIRVRRATEMPPAFHANRDVSHKIYRYFLFHRRRPTVFARQYCWGLRGPLDFARMQAASRALVGRHDFSAFRTGEQMTRTSIRDVRSIRFGRGPGRVRYIDVCANGFLRQMVRNLVGLLVEVGQDKRPVEFAAEVLASRDRTRASAAAPAQGLFLWRVHYRRADELDFSGESS